MRVIAGDFKGRKLFAPRGTEARPTSDRVKEAIFNMVQPDLKDSVCIDLFAGSGALGIEALSRGAERVYFCDIAPASLASLKQNLDLCRIGGQRAIVFAKEWRSAIMSLKEKCNLVFIDAPYNMCEYYSQILEEIAKSRVLEEGSRVVIERKASAGGYSLPHGFEKEREKRYGNIGVDLLIYADTAEEK